MDPLSILSIILTAANVVLIGSSQLYFWQRKEYRLDRVLSTLYDNELSWVRLFFIIPLLLFLVGYIFTLPLLGLLSQLTIISFYAGRAMTRGFFRPRWTRKSILLAALLTGVLFMYLPFIIFNPVNLANRLPALVLLVFPLAALTAKVANIITGPKKKSVMRQAAGLRRSLPSLRVVGVTGSYGKTSTKEFLSQIIPDAKTSRHHRNSEYIIAVDMLEQLKKDTQDYIVEMSAYRTGEIAQLAKIAAPDIGVITHIGNQHLALFGSRQKLIDAKWELIEALPADGIAVLNADDQFLTQKAKNYHGQIKWFSSQRRADVFAANIQIKPTSLEFDLVINNQPYPLSVNLLSEAYLSSILAASCAAHALGVPDNEIVSRLKQLKPLDRTMQLLPGRNDSRIVDDSYSANEQSVINAIKHLKRFPQTDKRIIMVPLIELGSEAAAVHDRLGQILRSSGCKVFVYGQAWQKQLGQPAYTNPAKLMQAVSADLSSNTVILIEGRVPDVIRKNIIT